MSFEIIIKIVKCFFFQIFISKYDSTLTTRNIFQSGEFEDFVSFITLSRPLYMSCTYAHCKKVCNHVNNYVEVTLDTNGHNTRKSFLIRIPSP